jgi:hypothetical protein
MAGTHFDGNCVFLPILTFESRLSKLISLCFSSEVPYDSLSYRGL